jgi:predicted nucleic acid-binding protein
MMVVDTNVMVYLLTASGPWEEAARLLAHDPQWAAPPILLSELRNVAVGLVRRGHLVEADALAICEDAEAILGPRVASVPSLPVLETAMGKDLSAYDAEFVVLARMLGVPLVTADQAILDGAPDVALSLEGALEG